MNSKTVPLEFHAYSKRESQFEYYLERGLNMLGVHVDDVAETYTQILQGGHSRTFRTRKTFFYHIGNSTVMTKIIFPLNEAEHRKEISIKISGADQKTVEEKLREKLPLLGVHFYDKYVHELNLTNTTTTT